MIRRVVLGTLLFTDLSSIGCGSQSYRLLPFGQDARLIRHCNVVVAATTTGGGIAWDQIPTEQWLCPICPMGATARWYGSFHVERVLKGSRANPVISIEKLAITSDDPTKPPPALVPLIFFFKGRSEYRIGYNFELFGHYYGLELMPAFDPLQFREQIPEIRRDRPS